MFFSNRRYNIIIITFIALLFIGSVIFLGARSNLEVQEIFEEQYTEQQTLNARQISSGVTEFLNEKIVALEVIAGAENGVPDDFYMRSFKSLYERSQGFYALQYIDENGTIASGYPEDRTPLGYNLYENNMDQAFQKTKTMGRTYITNPTYTFEDELAMYVWVPVYSGNDFKGTVLAIIRIEEITERVIQSYDSSAGYVYIIDDRGNLLYHSDNPNETGKNYFDILNEPDQDRLYILGEQTEGKEGTGRFEELNENNGLEEKLVSYVPIKWYNQVWSVGVVTPVPFITSIVRSIYLKQATFMIITTFFILFFTSLISLIFLSWNRKLEEEVHKKTELLENSNQRLQKLNRVKNEFLSMVSHELKTPLTAMRTSSEFLREEECDKETQEEMLDLIIRNIDRQSRMVDDLLDISRIESGRMVFKEEKINLKEIIDNAIQMMEPMATKNGIRIERDLDNDSRVKADKDKLLRVFVNLLNNAIKFTANKGENIKIETEEAGDFVEISVIDSGIGIPEKEQDKIFEKFYQVDSTSRRKVGGSGLGLAIIKGIIEGQGGSIRVKSEPGLGSTFTFTLRKWEE
ncbi:sensor histidine kinase [Methanohalophilus portucalensis]|uniref:histidine kinase n=2 Tax=Methanohalophilus portucalensis TaxID=39664 RepID=A0A1L9C761_9EURY|nr:sensor histidine kinase [Methanohalophilus portucalensis]ATU08952.1 histidine kinase [Methanohalophilus portucalensis]OJH50362.1 integral membrane sensor signal transduction histidine kinase [Methanohalophilus portucalensis FDF-1]RNI11204.1 sensor histidine kinase [Methanohalophilus portucalensis FDF-1]SMH29200.1 Signal transduction histidine kinase [Methanohalophilus portucalensis FDF-1]